MTTATMRTTTTTAATAATATTIISATISCLIRERLLLLRTHSHLQPPQHVHHHTNITTTSCRQLQCHRDSNHVFSKFRSYHALFRRLSVWAPTSRDDSRRYDPIQRLVAVGTRGSPSRIQLIGANGVSKTWTNVTDEWVHQLLFRINTGTLIAVRCLC